MSGTTGCIEQLAGFVSTINQSAKILRNRTDAELSDAYETAMETPLAELATAMARYRASHKAAMIAGVGLSEGQEDTLAAAIAGVDHTRVDAAQWFG